MALRLRFRWIFRQMWWWPLPAALAVIAIQQGLGRVGWMRLGDTAATVGRLVWSSLVVAWPLLVATGILAWQRRR